MFQTLFSEQEGAPRPRTTRGQMQFLVFYGAGNVLNCICLLGRPPHTHHGIWIWLSMLALVLMFVGIAFNINERYGVSKMRWFRPDANTPRV